MSLEHFPCSIYRQAYTTTLTLCSSSNRFQFSDRTMQTLVCVQYIQTGIHHNFEEPMFSQDVSRELYDNESPTTTKEVMHTPYHIDAHTLVTQRTLVTDPPSTLSTDPTNIMPSYNSIFTFKFTFYNLLTCQTYLV